MKIALIGATAFAISLATGLGGTAPARAATFTQEFAPFFTVTVTTFGDPAFQQTDRIQFTFDEVGKAWSFIGDPAWIPMSLLTWELNEPPRLVCNPICVISNEPVIEPIGKWVNPLIMWATPADTLLLVPNGSVNITLANDGPGGTATVTFRSEHIPPVPLPAALPLFVTGLGALAVFGWRRKRKAQVAID